jgi:hypothetical protein
MLRTFILIGFLLSVVQVEAQFRDKGEVGDLAGFVNSSSFSMNYQRPLLDPNRMSLRHSFSMGYSSASYGSYGSGSYLGSLEYRMSNTTDITLHVGLNSLMYNNTEYGGTNQSFSGGAEFRWNPSENFELRIGAFHGMPDQQRIGYYSPWSRNNFLMN